MKIIKVTKSLKSNNSPKTDYTSSTVDRWKSGSLGGFSSVRTLLSPDDLSTQFVQKEKYQRCHYLLINNYSLTRYTTELHEKPRSQHLMFLGNLLRDKNPKTPSRLYFRSTLKCIYPTIMEAAFLCASRKSYN